MKPARKVFEKLIDMAWWRGDSRPGDLIRQLTKEDRECLKDLTSDDVGLYGQKEYLE